MKLSEVMANQEGWQLMNCYTMEVRHDLMGFFPFVLKDIPEGLKERQQVVCSDIKELEKLWDAAPKKHVKVSTQQFLVNTEKKLAVYTNNYFSGREPDTDDFYLVLNAEEEIKQNVLFAYADEGLISSRSPETATFPTV